MKRSPLCRSAKNGSPDYRLRNQAPAPKVALDVRPGGVYLSAREDPPKDPKGKGIPHFQAMQPGEWQRASRRMDDSLGSRAVRISDVIRDEQTGVRKCAHAALLVPFFFARQKNEVWQHFVSKDSAPSRSRVRPANPASPFAGRLRCNRRFQLVDAVEEFPTLPRRQCLHLLQNFIRAHRPNHTTERAIRANSKIPWTFFGHWTLIIGHSEGIHIHALCFLCCLRVKDRGPSICVSALQALGTNFVGGFPGPPLAVLAPTQAVTFWAFSPFEFAPRRRDCSLCALCAFSWPQVLDLRGSASISG